MELNKKQKGINPIVITPPASLELPNFREFWEYRGLFFFLVRRDIKLRFQQTFIGFFWVVLQPLIQMLIFYVILGILIKVPTNGIPYHLFFLSAFVVWQFFSQVVNMSAFSLVGNIGVILKSYFPRLALPISSTVNALVDFGVGFLVLAGIPADRWTFSHHIPIFAPADISDHHHHLFIRRRPSLWGFDGGLQGY